MPSFTFDPSVVSQMNEKEIKEYLANLKADTVALTAAPRQTDASASDPVGSRNVVAEARRELTDASSSAAEPRTPAPPKTFTRASDRSAANATRLVFGSNPFHLRTRFVDNAFFPNFLHLFMMLSLADRKMSATDKFVRVAEFWTPLVSRIYVSVLLIIQVLLAMKSAGRLSHDNETFVNWFVSTFPLNTLPVPGFLVNSLQCISNVAVAATNYRSHCPELPELVPTQPRRLFMICNNLAMRLPNIPVLINQLAAHYATVNVANPVPTPDTVGRWNAFGQTVFATALTGAPTSTSDRTAITAVPVEQQWLFASPGFEPYLGNKNIGSNLLEYAGEMLALLPTAFRPAAAPTAGTAVTWRTFCGFGTSHRWFTEFARIMTDYSKHVKESCSMADISHIGHAGALIRASNPANLYAVPTTRYPDIDYTMSNVAVKSASVSESDELDGAVALVNTAELTAAPLAVHGFAALTPLHRGPYYELLDQRIAVELNPVDGFGQVFSDHYHVPNPRM
jgi:hypothetical protein